jgi:hypothetical protein
MSWLFSRALVAEYLAANCSDGEPSAQLNVMPTQHPFWRNDKPMEPLSLSQFGLTCAALTADRGAAVLTWCLGASPARTSAWPARATDSTEPGPGFGWKWPGSFAKWDRGTSSWKTRQHSLLGGWDEFSETWPRWGSMRDGECLALETPAHLISERESGLWLTPCATDAKPITGGNLYQTQTGSVRHMRPDGKSSNRGLAAQVTFPTPVSKSPTGGRMGLDGGAHALAHLLANHGAQAVKELTGGSLNPTWVEWLMGWPIEWTALKPLETGRFRQWPRSHGERS